ncbi:YbaN family protein [Massilia pseudoviolaceinigra]|uniref:YbaN family protein n=1 Tax=Massilia pseudoviolaceinigra TaxID=3057165 RepID=UPI002796B218|nr:YbaN family protein [Massilia sp. CCM 9206]MDQ1923148.1 YbaN family protein [Massilia sp. CCM 9206]
MKLLLNTIGCLAVLLGVLGIFLPLLPTTPFLLLASACFARGSTRMHAWLLGNKVFGKYLSDFEQGRGIPRRAKITILVLMWASLGYSMLRLQRTSLTLLLLCIGAGVTIYLLRYVPTGAPRAARLDGPGPG